MEILQVNQLEKEYNISKIFQAPKKVRAINKISFNVNAAETLGIVGESGCGKSTLAKILTKLENITNGEVLIDGKNILDLKPNELHETIQMVFQDPYQSLNPRKTAFNIVADPLIIQKKLSANEIKEKVLSTLEKVGIRAEMQNRYPHQFSGGQRQRLGIARSLMLNPKILILDEPVSALDVSIQAQVLNLLIELQNELKLTYLFISHDLSVIAHMSDRIIVMYLGEIVEYGTRDQIFFDPKHPYTKMLLESAPGLTKNNKDKIIVQGELEMASENGPGCQFRNRCPYQTAECKKEIPTKTIEGRTYKCIL